MSSLRLKTRRPAGHRDRRGTATVEFSLMVPIIFLLGFGAIEMANLNVIRHSAANAAYEGARRAVVPGATAEHAEEEVLRILDALQLSQGIQVEVDETLDRIQVTVHLPCDQNSWGLTRFCKGMTITQSCSLTRERTL